MTLKQELAAACVAELAQKIAVLQGEFRAYQEAAANESKSTAGDKHDTARSMMQLEQEKMGSQLQELLQQKKILESVPAGSNGQTGLGSILITDQGNFFLAVFSKPLQSHGQTYIPVSLRSPIGQLLLKTGIGRSFSLSHKVYTVLDILY